MTDYEILLSKIKLLEGKLEQLQHILSESKRQTWNAVMELKDTHNRNAEVTEKNFLEISEIIKIQSGAIGMIQMRLMPILRERRVAEEIVFNHMLNYAEYTSKYKM